jgi:carbonic anhydrase
MQSDWRLCAEGRRQSPIDLASPVEKKLPDVAVHRLSEHAVEVLTQEEVLEELDNGHTVQVNVKLPRALRIDKKSYSLQQFHFHSPSEHHDEGNCARLRRPSDWGACEFDPPGFCSDTDGRHRNRCPV